MLPTHTKVSEEPDTSAGDAARRNGGARRVASGGRVLDRDTPALLPRILLVCGWIALSSLLVLRAAPSPGADDPVAFDHARTRFPLTGAHERTDCERCHAGGVFAGTPAQCGACHLRGAALAETSKPLNHVPTTNACDDCHTTSTWSDVRFQHIGLTTPCASCHNNVFARGQGPDHIPAPATCDLCHDTVKWNL
jgi:hypothetical protein